MCKCEAKMSLSPQEGLRFLTSTLGMQTSVRDRKPTLELLNDIIRRFQQVQPFQSVTACAVLEEQRHLPTWSEIKEDMFAKKGGLCYNMNLFMKALLNALGYQVDYVSADIAQTNDHVTVVASNLRGNGSIDFIEVGCGYPTFQAFPLDFVGESPVYISGFLRHKFVRRGDSFIWYHEPRPAYRPIDETLLSLDGWYRYAEIKPFKTCDIKYFEPMARIYTNVEESNFLRTPRAVIFQDDKLIAIKGMQIIREKDARHVEKEAVHSVDDLLHFYGEHFPQLPTQTVKDALKHTGLSIE